MWQELARVLATLITHYQKLKQLNEEKHGILVLVKMQELEKLTAEEEKLIAAINQAENDRRTIMQKLAQAGINITATTRMDDVWAQCRDLKQREMLFKLHKMLSKLVSEVQEAQANNEILIKGALEAISYRLNQLGGSMVEPAYGSSGQEQVTHRQNFNVEA